MIELQGASLPAADGTLQLKYSNRFCAELFAFHNWVEAEAVQRGWK